MCQKCREFWDEFERTRDPNPVLKALAQVMQSTKDNLQKEHLQEVSDRILDTLVPVQEANEELDQDWWNAHHESE